MSGSRPLDTFFRETTHELKCDIDTNTIAVQTAANQRVCLISTPDGDKRLRTSFECTCMLQ